MTYREAARRAVITFLAGATSAPVSAALLDMATWKAIVVAGVAALWNWLGRTVQALQASFDPLLAGERSQGAERPPSPARGNGDG